MRIEIVNGYACKTCTDVELAKKGIDPAHPKDGPGGVYKAERADFGPAFAFDGALAGTSPSQQVQPTAYVPGATVDLKA